MRTVLALVLGSILAGTALAFGLHAATDGPRPAVEDPPCSAAWLKLAPTVAVVDDGTRIAIGLVAPGPAVCTVPSALPRTIRIRVGDAGGNTLVTRETRGGPPPGSLVTRPLRYGPVVVSGLRLCRARQPLRLGVWAVGVSVTVDLRLRLVNGRCAFAS